MVVSELKETIHSGGEKWKRWNATYRVQIEPTLQTSKEMRDQSVVARKNLADNTKQFKKSIKALTVAVAELEANVAPENASITVKAAESVGKDAKVIVNSYKEEIDNLTRRCKSVETSYASMTQALQELPDPAELLGSCVQALDASPKVAPPSGQLSLKERDELAELRREVAEYEVEFRSLKNQDITIRKLEGRIAEMQAGAAHRLEEQLAQARAELIDTEGRRATEALEREAAMARKVEKLELELKAERAGREATQAHLLEADDAVSQREAAWEAQRQIFMDDLERLRESLQVTTRERDDMRLKLASVQGKSGTSHASSAGVSLDDLVLERDAYEAEVSELAETANLLREEMKRKDVEFAEEKRSSQLKVDALEREKSRMELRISSMEQDLASVPNMDVLENMKRELRILKRLEYNADGDVNPEVVGFVGEDATDLESVLVSKLKKSETELVAERVARSELETECNQLRSKLLAADKFKTEQEKLVASLESDLAAAIATPTVTLVPKTSQSLRTSDASATLQNVLDPNAKDPSLPTTKQKEVSKSASDRAEDDHSVASIVMAQRDRLRARCDALEAERDSFKRELQAQVSAAESLKLDNTKLYEKVRYLQNYSSKGGRVNPADRDLDLEALEQRYEASVDPFRQFSRAERQRKLNEMSPMERSVFVVAKTVLATREMRTALFFYVLILHFLVFVTTYHWSHADQCTINFEHLSHLPPNAADHVREDLAASKEG